MPKLRYVLCILFFVLVAVVFFAADYVFINDYASKAKHDYVTGIQNQAFSRLRSITELKESVGTPAARQELAHIASFLDVPYIMLLDRNNNLLAGFSEEFTDNQLERLVQQYLGADYDSDEEQTALLNSQLYTNYSITLPDSSGTHLVYGVPLAAIANASALIYQLNLYAIIFVLLFILAGLGVTMLWLRNSSAPQKNDHVYDMRDIFIHIQRAMGALRNGVVVVNNEGYVEYASALALDFFNIASLLPAEKPLFTDVLNKSPLTVQQRKELRSLLGTDSTLPELRIGDGGTPIEVATAYLHPFTLYVMHDLSERHSVATLLQDSNDMLEAAIEQRTKELRRVNEQLRKENTERRAIEQALMRAESRYREIVNNSIEGIVQFTPDGRLLSANLAMARILGYPSVEDLLLAYEQPGGRLSYTAEMEQAIVELLEVRGWINKLEFQAMMYDGSPVWVASNARRVADSGGETLYYEAFIEDITSRKKTEEKLVYQAFHDPLTGLPNRALFLDRLRMSLRRIKRHEGYKFAVLYLDLDRFKNINDNFGHSAGDKMLNHATEKLLQCVREADTVARFGGDEFAVLLTDLERPAQAVHIAKRIITAFNDVITFHGQDVSIGASIGIVLNSEEYETPEEILRDADTAMYRAKMHGRRCIMVFNRRMREETMQALVLENDLRGAVERKEIEAYYQPLIQIEDGKVYGFEALMRWRRNGEIVSPLNFIPIAEETGIINELGLEMLEIVSRQIIEWNSILGHDNYTVHVNISGKQLMAKRFWRDVTDLIENTGVTPRQLIFEITESVFLDYGSQVISAMNRIRESGIRFCLDDFGTGFSSLSYLRLLPLESLKIDRSFIIDLPNDHYATVILRHLISMSNDLGLDVVAEGIDQTRQIDILRSIGCVYAQGFHFARPLVSRDAINYFMEHGCAGVWDA
ncbi:EAL domain-containing protein [Desulfovibrio sp. OttesenSCG-928-F07]|nr:EAL domain-containing protein [Desulfovibrio sp. OttesenSCG-928-F07]